MKALLEGLLPRVLPPGVHPVLVPHQGKSDLRKSIPRKLVAWCDPNARFVVVQDQDSAECTRLKEQLAELCAGAGHPETLIRIPCRELESWYLADLRAVDQAYHTNLERLQKKKKFRNPDHLGSPSHELKKLVPEFGKVSGARLMGPLLDVDNERSRSFFHFVHGVRTLTQPTER